MVIASCAPKGDGNANPALFASTRCPYHHFRHDPASTNDRSLGVNKLRLVHGRRAFPFTRMSTSSVSQAGAGAKLAPPPQN